MDGMSEEFDGLAALFGDIREGTVQEIRRDDMLDTMSSINARVSSVTSATGCETVFSRLSGTSIMGRIVMTLR